MRTLPPKLILACFIASVVWSVSHVSGCHHVKPQDIDNAIEIVQTVCDVTETINDCSRKRDKDAGAGGQSK